MWDPFRKKKANSLEASFAIMAHLVEMVKDASNDKYVRALYNDLAKYLAEKVAHPDEAMAIVGAQVFEHKAAVEIPGSQYQGAQVMFLGLHQGLTKRGVLKRPLPDKDNAW